MPFPGQVAAFADRTVGVPLALWRPVAETYSILLGRTQTKVCATGGSLSAIYDAGQRRGYNWLVQRVLAVLLLVLFNFSLIATFALADSEAKLPECCRRAGKHHCSTMGSMTMQASSLEDGMHGSSGPAVRPNAGKCPYSPRGGPSSPLGKTPLPRIAWTVVASLVSHPAGPAQTEARYRVSFSRVRQKRGPPSPLS
jgi:hypothetical protein